MVSKAGRFTFPTFSAYAMSKHAAIAFSDALRRETQKYGIKVSTIEPAGYEIQMANHQFISNSFDNALNESSKEVKNLYDKEHYLAIKHSFEIFMSNIIIIGKNINEVIDVMVDAIENEQPNITYEPVPGDLFNKFLNGIFIKYFPAQLIDFLLFMLKKRFKLLRYPKN